MTVDRRGAKGDGLSAQGPGQSQLVALERHPAARLAAAALIVEALVQRGRLSGIGPRADVVATGRDSQGQALVGSDMVVLVAPGSEGGLLGADGGPPGVSNSRAGDLRP